MANFQPVTVHRGYNPTMTTPIFNNFSRPVILADRRNADVSWNNHIKRGSAGGVDLAYPYGTPVKACASGVWEYIAGDGSGGNIGRIHLAEGGYTEYMHLSVNTHPSGSHVTAGAVVAKSGASGFGKDRYYSPHLHVDLVTPAGQRVNLFHHFAPTLSTSSTTTSRKLVRLMASPTGKFACYDAQTGVRYLVDVASPASAPSMYILGLSSSAEAKAVRADGAKTTKLTHEEVGRLVTTYGLRPWPLVRSANLPGAAYGSTAGK